MTARYRRSRRNAGGGRNAGRAKGGRAKGGAGEIVGAAGERACRPGSVHPLARAGGHPSGTAVAGSLLRSTRELGRAALGRSRRYRAARVTPGAGGLLHRRFTLTRETDLAAVPGRSVFCGTFPRVTPGRCYRPPCPVEPGPSSARPEAGAPRPPGLLARRVLRIAAAVSAPHPG